MGLFGFRFALDLIFLSPAGVEFCFGIVVDGAYLEEPQPYKQTSEYQIKFSDIKYTGEL